MIRISRKTEKWKHWKWLFYIFWVPCVLSTYKWDLIRSIKQKTKLLPKFMTKKYNSNSNNSNNNKKWVKHLVNIFEPLYIFTWLFLSEPNVSVSIVSFTTVIGAPVEIKSSSHTLVSSISHGIAKKRKKVEKERKKKIKKNSINFFWWFDGKN